VAALLGVPYSMSHMGNKVMLKGLVDFSGIYDLLKADDLAVFNGDRVRKAGGKTLAVAL
jgi:hypothetical protein